MKISIFSLCLLFSFNILSHTMAKYKLTIQSNWNVRDHLAVPNTAHFSPVVAISHHRDFNLLPLGFKANKALKYLAETGETLLVLTELMRAKKTSHVYDIKQSRNQFIKNQKMQAFQVIVTRDQPYISFVTMIAPSPDWIIGLNSLKMYNQTTGFTVKEMILPLYAFDAGTEDGDFGGNYSVNNQTTVPQQSISRLTGKGFQKPFGFVKIRRVQ